MSRALIIHHGRRVGGHWDTDEAGVLRATSLLRVLADHEVTWYTSEAAAPLLWGNALIDRVVTSPRTARSDLSRERFDLVVNLEPTPGCCALADGIRARRRAGYTWDASPNQARLRPTRTLGLPLLGPSYQDWLFALIDRRWHGEAYVLGYRPRSGARYDVGLNHLARPGAADDAWPHRSWTALHRRLTPERDVSMPVSSPSILDYIDWVKSCRTIVSGDGLGLHVAIALGKRVVALFGETDPSRVPLYGLGYAVRPPAGSTDIRAITPADVAAAVDQAGRVRRAG